MMSFRESVCLAMKDRQQHFNKSLISYYWLFFGNGKNKKFSTPVDGLKLISAELKCLSWITVLVIELLSITN